MINIFQAKRISDEVHKHQSVVYGQISHAGIKGYLNPVDFNDLSIDEINTIIQQFISGAKRLEQADLTVYKYI